MINTVTTPLIEYGPGRYMLSVHWFNGYGVLVSRHTLLASAPQTSSDIFASSVRISLTTLRRSEISQSRSTYQPSVSRRYSSLTFEIMTNLGLRSLLSILALNYIPGANHPGLLFCRIEDHSASNAWGKQGDDRREDGGKMK